MGQTTRRIKSDQELPSPTIFSCSACSFRTAARSRSSASSAALAWALTSLSLAAWAAFCSASSSSRALAAMARRSSTCNVRIHFCLIYRISIAVMAPLVSCVCWLQHVSCLVCMLAATFHGSSYRVCIKILYVPFHSYRENKFYRISNTDVAPVIACV